jgi:hypothetical protein
MQNIPYIQINICPNKYLSYRDRSSLFNKKETNKVANANKNTPGCKKGKLHFKHMCNAEY